jgi:hypothetical protein
MGSSSAMLKQHQLLLTCSFPCYNLDDFHAFQDIDYVAP